MAKAKPKPVGNRTGARGHWPKGKPRNEPSPDWPRVRKRLERLLRTPERSADPEAITRSRRGLARYLSVSDRQVRRWLALDDMPSVDRVQQIDAFCDHIIGEQS